MLCRRQFTVTKTVSSISGKRGVSVIGLEDFSPEEVVEIVQMLLNINAYNINERNQIIKDLKIQEIANK